MMWSKYWKVLYVIGVYRKEEYRILLWGIREGFLEEIGLI